MTQDRSPDDDREQAPVVIATLTGLGARSADAVRRTIASLDHRALMILWASAPIALFVLILGSSIAQTPGWEGILTGVFGGGFLALLAGAGIGWLLLWARTSPSVTRGQAGAGAADLDALLAPTLRELNAVRADVIRQVKARSVTRIPLGIAGAFAFWVLTRWSNEPPGAFDLVLWLVFGAVAGEVWAFTRLQGEYQRLYKTRVLPVLAGRLGDLTYRHATADDVHQLRAFRILPEYDSVRAEDEIAGTHRGLGLRIVEARLEHGSGDSTRTVFDGLLVELMLPRNLTGTTAVLTDEGFFRNLKTRWQTDGMECVRLEDPDFERRFEVYSNDQIEARALLTPAFMERFKALAGASGFSLPGALAEGNRLVVALPKTMGMGDLFEPPVYWKPAGGQALVALDRDIRAVLDMADTVVALDFWAAGRR